YATTRVTVFRVVIIRANGEFFDCVRWGCISVRVAPKFRIVRTAIDLEFVLSNQTAVYQVLRGHGPWIGIDSEWSHVDTRGILPEHDRISIWHWQQIDLFMCDCPRPTGRIGLKNCAACGHIHLCRGRSHFERKRDIRGG